MGEIFSCRLTGLVQNITQADVCFCLFVFVKSRMVDLLERLIIIILETARL